MHVSTKMNTNKASFDSVNFWDSQRNFEKKNIVNFEHVYIKIVENVPSVLRILKGAISLINHWHWRLGCLLDTRHYATQPPLVLGGPLLMMILKMKMGDIPDIVTQNIKQM